jgi:hypothetical protein
MLRSKLRAVLLGAPMCFALASCSLFERDDHSALQGGSSQAGAGQPAPNAWPGPNVGNPIPLTGAAGQGSGPGVALSGASEPQASNGRYQTPNRTRLVDVDLKKLRQGIAGNLHVDASKVPATLALPVGVAANLCGVEAAALAAQRQPGGGNPTCLANNLEMATDVVEPSIE